MLRWYQQTNESRFVRRQNLRAARMPSVLLGAIGCVALFALGTLTCDRRVGVVAACLLAINPLYRLHARRAMADVPAEAFVLLTLAVGLLMVIRLSKHEVSIAKLLSLATVTGILGGLAVLTKLNGGLALMVVGAWMVYGLVLQPRSTRKRVSSLLCLAVIGIIALIVFVELNPCVTARPPSVGSIPLMSPLPLRQSIPARLGEIVQHRVNVSRMGQNGFPNDALRTVSDKLSALAIQGFGRFGPFGPQVSDSTKRYDAAQDWGVVIWLPLVLLGLVRFLTPGRARQKATTPSVAWVVPLAYFVSLVTVGLFLPLAWDRYFLPIQSGSCLLAAGAIVGAFDLLRRRGTPR